MNTLESSDGLSSSSFFVVHCGETTLLT